MRPARNADVRKLSSRAGDAPSAPSAAHSADPQRLAGGERPRTFAAADEHGPAQLLGQPTMLVRRDAFDAEPDRRGGGTSEQSPRRNLQPSMISVPEVMAVQCGIGIQSIGRDGRRRMQVNACESQ